MKKYFLIAGLLLATIASATFTSCDNVKSVDLKNDIDSMSYLQGMNIGSKIAPQLSFDPKMNKEEFIKGFKSGLYSNG